MPFADKAYDIVISLGVLEHFENFDLQQEAVKEHVRILKDDGTLLITVPFVSWIRILIHMPFLKLVSFVRKLKNKKEYFSEYRYSRNAFESVISDANLKVVDIVYDDLMPPYNFGLMDHPVRKLFRDKTKPYFLNQFGIYVYKFLWDIHPKLVSGGIGFICKKK
jgi:SAM-dependent methyltransferase